MNITFLNHKYGARYTFSIFPGTAIMKNQNFFVEGGGGEGVTF